MSLDKSVWAEEKVKIFPYDVIEESMIRIKYAKPLACFYLVVSFEFKCCHIPRLFCDSVATSLLSYLETTLF
jgi:hypothetical protein